MFNSTNSTMGNSTMNNSSNKSSMLPDSFHGYNFTNIKTKKPKSAGPSSYAADADDLEVKTIFVNSGKDFGGKKEKTVIIARKDPKNGHHYINRVRKINKLSKTIAFQKGFYAGVR